MREYQLNSDNWLQMKSDHLVGYKGFKFIDNGFVYQHPGIKLSPTGIVLLEELIDDCEFFNACSNYHIVGVKKHDGTVHVYTHNIKGYITFNSVEEFEEKYFIAGL